MGESYHYVCEGCRFDIVAGSLCVECPRCGGGLKLINVGQLSLPIAPLRDGPPVTPGGIVRTAANDGTLDKLFEDLGSMLRQAAEEHGE